MEQKLLLIDGNSLINRAYYAFGMSGGLSWDGAPTNATFGFLNMFLKAVTDIGVSQVVVAFDVRAKTFRHKMYDGYKCTRKGMPDDLAVQLSDLKELLKIMSVTFLECEGYEADDIIGTLAKKCGNKSIILSADRDGLQLVDERTELYLTKTGVSHLDVWDEKRIKNEYGLTPSQLIDLKALMGDKSDCIPGAAGVGEKTALLLMQEFGSVEAIYQNLDKLKGSLRDKIEVSKEAVFLSRDLARIDVNVPIVCDFDNYCFPYPMDKAVYDAFDARGFKSLCKRSMIWREDYYSDDGLGESARTTGLSADASVDGDCEEIPGNSADGRVEEVFLAIGIAETADVIVKDLNKINLCAERIAISYDAEAYYVNQYKIPIKVDLLSGGFDENEIIAALKPLFESDVPKAVFDSKALKERSIKIKNVIVDVKICEHLLTSKTLIEPRRVTLADFGLLDRLERTGMLPLYRDIELPLVDILIDMQKSGARLNLEALESASKFLQAQIGELSQKIYAYAGETFNINSPQQLGVILFKKLGIETTRKNKTGFSTDEYELTKRAGKHPIVPYILRYRKVFKLYSTYVQGFKNLADENGFVHSTFNNTGTVTGRLSSSEPNLQNIPARSEDSEFIRKLFISRYPGGKIIAADYSQIELRLLAHFSDDEVMKQAFINGRDIHTETALKIFGEVTPEIRRQAKAVNFGIVYGISAFGLSENIGCSVSDAARFIERYFAQFPRVKTYLDKSRDSAIMNGYASTIVGRRRQLPELTSTNHNVVQFGVRAAVNMPMQGSASDIVKKAMVQIGKHDIKAKLIAQVHDELIFDCPDGEIESSCAVIKKAMEDAVKISVPLTVDIKIKDTF